MADIHRAIRKKFHIHGHVFPPYAGWIYSVREMLYELFNEIDFRYGAEVGVEKGKNAHAMFKRIKDLRLICVDPWCAYKRNSQERAEKYYEIAKRLLKDCNVEWIRNTSVEGSKVVADRSLDFVYIDGLHDFDNVMLDILHWVPKVKRGGIIAGHDYYYGAECNVPRAVDAYVFAHGIKDLYVTRDNMAKGKYPYTPSWFFVNP